MPANTLKFTFGIYEGETDDTTGLRHGHGTLRYNNGNIYSGQWVGGAATGAGQKVWANGDSYEGEFLEGSKHGEGSYTFANGALYVGSYVADTPEGRGMQLMPNGDKYDGEWRAGRRHGLGTETLHDGQCYEGSFAAGKKHGRGVVTKGDEVITAIWENDRCVEVVSREGAPSDASHAPVATQRERRANAPLPMEEMLAEMQGAGVDPALLNQIAAFNTNVFGQMERVIGGLGSLDTHLQDLHDCLEEIEGVNAEGAE